MRNSFLIFLLLLSFLSVDAQRADLIYGTEKKSDDFGMYKLKILKNGNTAHVGLEKKSGFFCTLYDVNKKKIGHAVVPTEYEVDMFIMKAMFEANNDIVVMMQVYAKEGPTLTRYIFDGSTAQLKKKEVVATMPIIKAASMANGGRTDMPDFFVQKDFNSDNYAVVCFDSFSKYLNKVIEVIHFTPAHEIITRAFLPIPEVKYLNYRYTDIYVNGAKSVIIASYLYSKKGDTDACFYLSELQAGQSTFKNKRSVETKCYFYGEANFMYNKVTKSVKLVTTVLSGSDPKGKIVGFNTVSQTLNLETLALSDNLILYSNKVDAMYRVFLPTLHYQGLVQNLCIDAKGNTIFVSEMITVYTNPENDSRSMEAEEIGISGFSPTGQEKYGQLVHYRHMQILRCVSLLYTKVPGGQYRYPVFDEFDGTYIGLIPGKKNNYMFLNNTPERSDKPIDKWPGFQNSVRPGKEFFTSYIYTLNDEGVISKDFIFGKPTSAEDYKYCLFKTADYNPETGMYAVIVIERIKGKKTAGVVWMNLN